jgi:hypothetical protein
MKSAVENFVTRLVTEREASPAGPARQVIARVRGRQAVLLVLALLSGGCAPSLQSARAAAATAEAARTTAAIDVLPPVAEGSVRFAVIGDSGTGDRQQYETAATLAQAHAIFPFTFVIMLGDNIYGSEEPSDYARKFEIPYGPLLRAGVSFYAVLGNHDEPEQRFYEPFNMNGERYYTFSRQNVRFFALDSNQMDDGQVAWLQRELEASDEDWKIAFFHHPLYSSGARHGSETDLRTRIEPLFVEHGVRAVFSGHDHVYERIRPQKGIHYFTAGAAAKLRRGDLRETSLTAAGFDSDRSFMLVEIAGDRMTFQTISRAGRRVDEGTIPRLDPTTARSPVARVCRPALSPLRVRFALTLDDDVRSADLYSSATQLSPRRSEYARADRVRFDCVQRRTKRLA